MDVISAIPNVNWIDVKDAPLLTLLLADSDAAVEASGAEEEEDKKHRHSARHRPLSHCVPTVSSHKRKRATKVTTVSTTVTPIVHSLIAPFFNVDFTVVGDLSIMLDEELLVREQPEKQLTSAGDIVKYKVFLAPCHLCFELYFN